MFSTIKKKYASFHSHAESNERIFLPKFVRIFINAMYQHSIIYTHSTRTCMLLILHLFGQLKFVKKRFYSVYFFFLLFSIDFYFCLSFLFFSSFYLLLCCFYMPFFLSLFLYLSFSVRTVNIWNRMMSNGNVPLISEKFYSSLNSIEIQKHRNTLSRTANH